MKTILVLLMLISGIASASEDLDAQYYWQQIGATRPIKGCTESFAHLRLCVQAAKELHLTAAQIKRAEIRGFNAPPVNFDCASATVYFKLKGEDERIVSIEVWTMVQKENIPGHSCGATGGL